MPEQIATLIPNVLRTWAELQKSFLQTLEMVGTAALVSSFFGVLLGVVLTVTAPGGLTPSRLAHQVLDKAINVFRSVPFIIMIALLLPLTRIISGTSFGTRGAIFPLIVGTVPFFARQINSALMEVDPGMVEAARAMGLPPLAIVWRVYLREGLPGMIRGAAITIVNLVALSAMAGSVGGGGLGDYAIRYGFQRSMVDVTFVTVAILLALVTLVQSTGSALARRLNKN
ncbi:MAG TPA: methionine ABC transporter permease [Candidatus Limnocylindria bacterium]|nr:methionine ABC transporter permease [Candidatus Limnocylindria bacterium]